MSKSILGRIYSQNFDGLEERLGSGPGGSIRLSDFTVYLHGKIDHYRCTMCNFNGPIDEHTFHCWLSGSAPACCECKPTSQFGRPLRVGVNAPDITLYNEALPEKREREVFEANQVDYPNVDLLIIVGTSLRTNVVGALSLAQGLAKNARKNAKGKLAVFFVNPKEPPDYFKVYDWFIFLYN